MSACHSAGVDYTDPRFLPGGGVVRFNPILGLHSTCVTIPILSDNIAEGTEYFALSFVAISDGDDLCVTPVEPTMAIVAINDPNGKCPLGSRCVWVCFVLIRIKSFTHLCISSNVCIICTVTAYNSNSRNAHDLHVTFNDHFVPGYL